MSGIMSMLLGARTAIAAAVDEFFNRVTLLLPGNGTNGAQNNTFLDSSNNFTITRNGNTTQGTFSPFSQTGWSNFFDGSGDYLTASYSTTNFDWFTTGTDFTLEAWIFPTSFTGWHYTSGVQYPTLIGNSAFNSETNYWSFGPISDGTVRFIYYTGASPYVTSTQACVLNQWNHIALTKTSSGIAIFVNGVGTTATAISGTPQSSTGTALTIGAGNNAYINGYVSNLRIVKGTAIYSGTTYTVPTAPLTDVANTKLLTCQSNRFFDASSVANTITVNGNPSVQASSPFLPTIPYSALTVGGSGYFDAAGDYLSWSGTTFGTSAFTIECWVYLKSIPAGGASFMPILGNNNINNMLNFRIASSTSINLDNGLSASAFTVPTLVTNNWYHIVAVRNSSNQTTVFLNGTRSSTGAVSVTTNYSTATTFVGAHNDGSLKYFDGYMAGLRLVVGSSEYDPTQSSITVPTAPPTAVTNTQLLLNYTNAGITDATAKNDLETVGNAQISTTQSKFGGSSMYFDGTGDYLVPVGTNTAQFTFPGDFTIELWIYVTNISSYSFIFDGRASGVTSGAWLVDLNGAVIGWGPGSSIVISSSSILANTWYHLAICRSGSSTRMFLNGTQTGSTYTDSGSYTVGTNRPIIGGSGNSLGSFNFPGYIDDLRITKGAARYTANFTAPTAAFPLQ